MFGITKMPFGIKIRIPISYNAIFDRNFYTMDAETIEKWISAIESSNTADDKEIDNLISLWKFTACYSDDAKITGDGLFNDGTGNNIKISFTDVALTDTNVPNVLSSLGLNIGTALHELKDSHYVLLHEESKNYTPARLLALEEEIINAIQGKIIPYHYVKRITRVNGNTGIYTNAVVKKCNRQDILSAITNSPAPKDDSDWLVLILDNLTAQCDSFYFDMSVLSQPFVSNYDKIMLFDFYKSEIIELVTGK